jgi:hypothetical protein
MAVPRLQHVFSGTWLDVGLNAGAQGGALYTAGTARSTYRTIIGDPVIDEQRVGLIATHGELRELFGVRFRPIAWEGELRVTAAALATIRTARDVFRLADGVMTFYDDDGTVYANCTIAVFDMGEKRTLTSDATLTYWVPYRIVIEQRVI